MHTWPTQQLLVPSAGHAAAGKTKSCFRGPEHKISLSPFFKSKRRFMMFYFYCSLSQHDLAERYV